MLFLASYLMMLVGFVIFIYATKRIVDYQERLKLMAQMGTIAITFGIAIFVYLLEKRYEKSLD